ncbi:hypothetical protein D081_1972 [Anaerovibrio sp. JC8]|uniref:hypothetical protein n=1 Tax=Anaerovibrio sp. JC8 TaxID=1240085 RepID=UPI000A0EA494|nr:hypothetical protein [Anaerovibrio sp. JC8]ORT99420.1 hypothetical protein D081_1972 [Anaerovibrio sp. JC8]
MKKAEMMNKMELDIMAMENVSGGTVPPEIPPALVNETGPLGTCDPPKGTGPLGNAVGPVNDWRR